MFWTLFFIVSCIKLLLIPAYRSTDFEVHRNWLAVTYSLPLSKWYYENTSEWTLDYPPIFAYFEFILSQIARFFDDQMLVVNNLNYSSNLTLIFLRLSVIVTDVVYALGVKSCVRMQSDKKIKQTILAATLLGHIGLFYVDHIHFQYNGVLFGILLLSISKIQSEQFIQSALYFAVLLNMKHIFVYIAPVYVIYLLKFYCLRSRTPIVNLLKLGICVIGVTLISFGPFYKQIPQVLSRLFPFKRGLCHAYWSPNFWTLYNLADKGASFLLKVHTNKSVNTGGLVQEFDHNVLPSIKPIFTFILTAITILPCLIKLWLLKYNKYSTPQHFIQAITLSACTSFMFGWHVHEKAIIMVSIPLSLLSTGNITEAASTLFLSIVASYSLLPLLYKDDLLVVKFTFLFLYVTFLFIAFKKIYQSVLLHKFECIYLLGFLFVFLYEHFVQYLFDLDKKFQFLPLLLISAYCSIGVSYFWLTYYIKFLDISNVFSFNKNK